MKKKLDIPTGEAAHHGRDRQPTRRTRSSSPAPAEPADVPSPQEVQGQSKSAAKTNKIDEADALRPGPRRKTRGSDAR